MSGSFNDPPSLSLGEDRAPEQLKEDFNSAVKVYSNQAAKDEKPTYHVSPAAVCKVCEEAISTGNEAVTEHFDNFQRFYLRPMMQHLEDSRSAEVHGPSRNQSYQYTPLADHGYTRLLCIKPGEGDEPIQCSLQEMDIDAPPKYTALSYTWGAADGKITIDLDGCDFLVTDNLWHALWHIRSKDQSLIIWIDALCINQNDVVERNTVVRRMKDIYERADHIIAWLGPESHNGATALLTVGHIYEHFNKQIDKFGTPEAAFKYMLDHRSWAGEEHVQAAEKQWFAVDTLLNRTWFYRMWIVQEGTTPVPTTFQLCKYTVPRTAVYTIFRLLQSVPRNAFPRNVVKDPFNSLRMHALTSLEWKRRQWSHAVSSKRKSSRFGKSAVTSDTHGLPLLDALEILRGHSASDPHDKVYAALGFAIENSEAPIEIDYRKSLAEMLRNVAISCLHQREHKLRFLGHAGIWGSSHMPASWIPDFLVTRTIITFPKEPTNTAIGDKKLLFDACAANHPIWNNKAYSHLNAAVDGDTLTVPGIIVDYVLTISVLIGDSENIDSLETAWVVPEMDEIYAPTKELRETAYLRTLVADVNYEDSEVVGRGASMYWRNGVYKPHNHTDVELAMQSACMHRRFITTLKHGYLGLGPYFALQGDAIFMLKGGEMLYLARPTMDGTYHFVGEVYLHGMMDGAVVERFNNGQGTLQLVEFAPVRNEVLDSTKLKPGSIFKGVTLTHKYENVAFNVRRSQLKNPNDDMEVFVHKDVGPRIDGTLKNIMIATLQMYVRQGLSKEDAVRKTIVEGDWADAAEQTLLTEYPIQENGSSSNCGLAGRDFARRSYIRATIAQEKVRIATMILGGGQNILQNGQILTLSVDYEKDLGESGKKTGKEAPHLQNDVNKRLADDELLARQLQEEEYAKTSNATPREQQPKPQQHLYPSSLTAQNSLRYPRVGPPVVLRQEPTHNPWTFKYRFQTPSDYLEFSDDLKVWLNAHEGEKPPILFGRWATDPKKRPRVELIGYGSEGRIWWEDEEGNEVPGPDEQAEWMEQGWGAKTSNELPNRTDEREEESQRNLAIGGGSWKGLTREQNDIPDTQAWEEAVRFGGWDGDDEAEVPREFVLW